MGDTGEKMATNPLAEAADCLRQAKSLLSDSEENLLLASELRLLADSWVKLAQLSGFGL